MDNKKAPDPAYATMLDSNAKAQSIPPIPKVADSRQATPPAVATSVGKKGGNGVAQAVGAGVGAVIGAAGGAVLTGMRVDNGRQDEHVDNVEENDVDNMLDDVVVVADETIAQQVSYQGNVPLAHGVNDNMSFAQAFSSARAEVGSGGVFQWHGQTYNTFTASEWDSMGHDQQVAFGQAAVGVGPAPAYTPVQNHMAQNSHVSPTPQPIVPDDDVVILGVHHDDESGTNIGALMIDDEPLVVIDVDGDMEFDYLMADVDGDGEIQDDEIFDISGGGLTVDSLGGFTDGANANLYAQNDEPDYSNDAII